MSEKELTVQDGAQHGCSTLGGQASPEVARSLASLREALEARRSSAGVTLIEVLIVVAIMALLASGVSFAILPKYREAQVSTAKTSAQVMRRAVQDWQRVNNEVVCPTVSQLVEGRHIDSGAEVDDPWGMPWHLVCTDDDVFVQSDGPDKKQGTTDDISVPKLRGDSES